MFGTNWSLFVDARVYTKSDSANFANSMVNILPGINWTH